MEATPDYVWWIGAVIVALIFFVLWRGVRFRAKAFGTEVEAEGVARTTTKKAEPPATTPGVAASGSSSIAIGGGVTDSTVVSGSHNRVTSIKGDRNRIG